MEQEVALWLMENKDAYVIEHTDTHIVVLCPNCGDAHKHGGDPDDERGEGAAGSRAAHCVVMKGSGGYEIDDFTPAGSKYLTQWELLPGVYIARRGIEEENAAVIERFLSVAGNLIRDEIGHSMKAEVFVNLDNLIIFEAEVRVWSDHFPSFEFYRMSQLAPSYLPGEFTKYGWESFTQELRSWARGIRRRTVEYESTFEDANKWLSRKDLNNFASEVSGKFLFSHDEWLEDIAKETNLDRYDYIEWCITERERINHTETDLITDDELPFPEVGIPDWYKELNP